MITIVGAEAGETRNVTSIVVPLVKPEPEPWERNWQPGDVAVVKFRGADLVTAAPGWDLRHDEGASWAWRILDAHDDSWPTFYVAQVADHVDWDLMIIAGESLEGLPPPPLAGAVTPPDPS
jgi:hypothetical protein